MIACPFRTAVIIAIAAPPRPACTGLVVAARENVVYDWRAPIATLFYDYETGPARYESPEGEVDCTIQLKRQFRISGDEIQLMIDSAVHVVDDVLQEELSRSSDESMKNIVATIQRDQNRIVRDDEAQELIIQRVAGSGKTSIRAGRRRAYGGMFAGASCAARWRQKGQ